MNKCIKGESCLHCDTDYCRFKDEVAELKAENERLKESLEISQGLCETLEKAKANEHNHWFNRCCEINTECDKYRSTLQEIKKYIAEICKEECGYVQQKRCLDSDCRYGQILDKINEVIGAE